MRGNSCADTVRGRGPARSQAHAGPDELGACRVMHLLALDLDADPVSVPLQACGRRTGAADSANEPVELRLVDEGVDAH